MGANIRHSDRNFIRARRSDASAALAGLDPSR